MNDKNGKELKKSNEPLAAQGESSTGQAPTRKRAAVVAMVGIVAIAAVVVFAWLLWPSKTGKPVPAPRSDSFGESASPQTATGERVLTLSTEQVQSAGLTIEIVGEGPSTEAAGQMTTGVIQANSYKETPVVSLVGGIVRSVGAELGQNIRRGQSVAVVFSNELADAQARYLAAVA